MSARAMRIDSRRRCGRSFAPRVQMASGARAAARARRGGTRRARGTSCEDESLQLREHERLDGRVRDHAVIADLLRAAEVLRALEEAVEALAIVAKRVAVDAELTDLSGLRVGETE